MYYDKFTRQSNISPCMQQSPYLQPLLPSAPSSPGMSPVQQSMGQLPTGIPLGPAQATTPAPQTFPQAFPQPTAQPGAISTTPQTVESTLFVPGFLKTQIGQRVRVEFLIGTSGTTDRSGVLIGVGASYILLREPQEDNIIMADLYSIKFVTILR